MTSSRPYFIRAIYEWLIDNQMTPYIIVDAMASQVEVPENYVENGKIILNVAPMAVRNLEIVNTDIQFDARFSGITYHIYAPMSSVMAIYAFENGRGMIFDDKEDADSTDIELSRQKKTSRYRKPDLRLVK